MPPPSGEGGGTAPQTMSVPPGLQPPAPAAAAAPVPCLPVLLMLPALGLRRISPAKG